jgi:hypothetical protein
MPFVCSHFRITPLNGERVYRGQSAHPLSPPQLRIAAIQPRQPHPQNSLG